MEALGCSQHTTALPLQTYPQHSNTSQTLVQNNPLPRPFLVPQLQQAAEAFAHEAKWSHFFEHLLQNEAATDQPMAQRMKAALQPLDTPLWLQTPTTTAVTAPCTPAREGLLLTCAVCPRADPHCPSP